MIIIRKQEIVKLEDVLHLYQAVGWTNYTHQPQMLEDYKDAYQVQLVTEETEKNVGFYRSIGFEILSTYNCIGMTWANREK